MPKTLRVVLADEQNLCRVGIGKLLSDAGFAVVAHAATGKEAIACIKQHRPDVVITDVALPAPNGIEVARFAAQTKSPPRMIALGCDATPSVIAEFIRAGGSAFVLKRGTVEELVAAVARETSPEKPFLSAEIRRDAVMRCLGAKGASAQGHKALLSRRERQVLRLLSEGNSTAEAAGALELSIKTIETYRKTLMDKLGLYTIAELTKYALIEGIAVDARLQPIRKAPRGRKRR